MEQGTHKDLYANASSVYHSLVKLQEQAMDKRANADEAAEPSATSAAGELALLPAGGTRADMSGKDRSSAVGSKRRSSDVNGLSAPDDNARLPGEGEKKEELVRLRPRCATLLIVKPVCALRSWSAAACAHSLDRAVRMLVRHQRACLLLH